MTFKHAYAIGRIRALEAQMLEQDDIARMAEANEFEGAFSVLNETCYAKHQNQLPRPFDYEEMLKLELKDVKELLAKLAPHEEELKIFIEKINSGQKIDSTFDKQFMALLKNQVKKSNLPFFIKLAETYIKLIGQKIALRKNPAVDKPTHLFEKSMDDTIIEQIRRAKYMAFGVEPLIAFLLAKEFEAQNIRLILNCKKNHIPVEQIKERLRKNYA